MGSFSAASVDAQFYFLDCKFSARMRNEPIRRMIYREGARQSPTASKADLDKQNIPGERSYFYNCHRDSGDFDWFANNLSSAPGSPKAEQITAAWTFNGKWDPENKSGPVIRRLGVTGRKIALNFSETVTVKGKPRVKMHGGDVANYVSGSGTDTLSFELASDSDHEVRDVDLNGGAIVACEASARLRPANLSLPATSRKLTTILQERFDTATGASLRVTSLRSSDRQQDSVVDLPRADPMKLNDGLSFGPRGVLHASRPETE